MGHRKATQEFRSSEKISDTFYKDCDIILINDVVFRPSEFFGVFMMQSLHCGSDFFFGGGGVGEF